MNIRRRKFLGVGAGVGALFAAGRYLPQFFSSQEPLELAAAYSSISSKRKLIISHRWDALGSLKVIRSSEFTWKPHAFFKVGDFLISTEQRGNAGAVFHQSSLETASQLQAPDGILFYGHGFGMKRGPATHIILSAFRPSPNLPEIYSRSGYLPEYKLAEDGSTLLIEMHPTEGFVPHHFAFNDEMTEMAYTTKYTENERSQIIICDPVEFKPKRRIEIGIVENGFQRRLTHLLSSGNSLYYSFIEWSGKDTVGGGIGLTDWTPGEKPHWESTYSEQMQKFAWPPGPQLDLALFQGVPIVALQEVGALLMLNVETQKFTPLNLPGVTGAVFFNNRFFIASRLGVQQLNPDLSLTPLAPVEDRDLIPVSHLFYSSG